MHYFSPLSSRFLVSAMLVAALGVLTGCSGGCDADQATNRMLALNKLQARLFAQGGEGITTFAIALQSESGAVSELIAQQRYNEACAKVLELEKRYKLDLTKEAEGMLTIEQLRADGGKGTGSCSIADAAKKQMELHSLLQKEVDAGRKSSSIFSDFAVDTQGYGEMLATDPSKACELFESLRKKYGV
jgi:hypothetical protein